MISFPLFLLSIFVFAVLAVAGVGFFFDNLSFLWLALINFILFLIFWFIAIIVRKPSHSTKEVKSHDLPADQESMDQHTDDKDVKSAHYSQHQQFVKYNYHHKKTKKHSLLWVLLIFGITSALILFLNRDSLTRSESNQDDIALSGYAESILSSDMDSTGTLSSGQIVQSTGEVLSTGFSTQSTTGIHLDSSFVDTGSIQTTPKVVTSSLTFTDKQSVTLLESVVYLLQTHDTPLLTKKDVKFSTVSSTNPYYKYWYTAFKKGLVGQTSSASSYVSCQTYFVLKGLLEGWNVQYTSANVKTQFWAEAKERNILNGCVFGTILKGKTLN